MKKIIIGESKIHGKGIIADEPIKEGDEILVLNVPITEKKIETEEESYDTINWIGADRDKWLDTSNTPFRFINHSCFPNAAMNHRSLIALSNIEKGEEINIDYSMTDADPLWKIDCECGTKNCRREIRAIYTVPEEVFKRHFEHVSEPFQKIYFKNYIDNKYKKES